jgi:hypothetical protein
MQIERKYQIKHPIIIIISQSDYVSKHGAAEGSFIGSLEQKQRVDLNKKAVHNKWDDDFDDPLSCAIKRRGRTSFRIGLFMIFSNREFDFFLPLLSCNKRANSFITNNGGANHSSRNPSHFLELLL